VTVRRLVRRRAINAVPRDQGPSPRPPSSRRSPSRTGSSASLEAHHARHPPQQRDRQVRVAIRRRKAVGLRVVELGELELIADECDANLDQYKDDADDAPL